MAPDTGSSREHRALQAEGYYKKGLELKASGQQDPALTEFRRAVLADPAHAPSHYEIGLLSKTKAVDNPYFLRLAFEAFRNAARLDLNNQPAHDQYIMLGQKMGQLDALHSEYDALAKANPDNPFFERCAKNIVTLSMALIPDPVNLASGANTNGIRKFLLFSSLGAILFGLILLLGPAVTNKFAHDKLTPHTIKRSVILGFISIAGGAGGFFLRGRVS